MRRIAYWLSLILLFVIPWENIVAIDGLGTISRATGLGLAAYWIVTVLMTGRYRRPEIFHVAVCLFIVWGALSISWSIDVNTTSERVATYLQLFGLLFIIWDLYTTPSAVKAGLQAYVLGIYVAVFSTLSNFLNANTQGQYNSYSATGFNTDDLGVILALGLPVAWYLATTPSKGKLAGVLRLVNYACVPVILLGIALSGNRAGAISLVPGMLFGLVSLNRVRLSIRILILTLLIGAILAVLPIIPATSYERLGTIGSEITEGDLNGRTAIWSEGLQVFIRHPFVGIGSGAFPMGIESHKVAHNVYLSVLVELGSVGFLLFGTILALAALAAIRHAKWDAAFWLTILIVWAMGASAMTLEMRKPTWMFLSLVVASASTFKPASPKMVVGVRSEDAKYAEVLQAEAHAVSTGSATCRRSDLLSTHGR